MEIEDDDLVPRDYQVQLLVQAQQQNTILYLPTGSGKTFVAIMLLKHMSRKIEKSLAEGGQRSFFLVNTVALVSQQAASIRRHTPFNIGEYTGDMNVDFWDKSTWDMEIKENNILVMTSQIYLNMLMHGYIHLKNCNLLIFDECHHAVSGHPMRMVMQQFEHCPVEEHPKVLGLTATLINRSVTVQQVVEEVKILETTFQSQIATVSHMNVVKNFSTNPIESIVAYQEPVDTSLSRAIDSDIKQIQAKLKTIDFTVIDNMEHVRAPSGSIHLRDTMKTYKSLKNLFDDLLLHIKMFGLYGGSKACLAHLIQLERRKCRADNPYLLTVLDVLITALNKIRVLIDSSMMNCADERTKIFRHSSSKVTTLFRILKQHSGNDGNIANFCCVVFVQRRFTAKILYHILKSLAANDPEYSFIRPDFIVGFQNRPYNDTREGKYERKQNAEVIRKFNHKLHLTNLMVSSNVLEEGIDIPTLNLVVKFDLPVHHSSYIQSKGRARHSTSNYVIMILNGERESFMVKYRSFQEVEKKLQELLVGKNELRSAPLKEAIETCLYEQDLPPYFTKGEGGPSVSMSSAVQLLNRYCGMLPQDKFTHLQPEWFLNTNGSVSVLLPTSSLLKELVTGAPMNSKKNGKRAAALQTCKQLHEIGDLDENLLPRGRVTPLLDDSDMFPLWKNEHVEDGSPRPGTKKKRRCYNRKFPDALTNCRATAGSVSYLHNIVLTPLYSRPDLNRRAVFYDFLATDHGFAILSSKPMPQVCDFTIFMNVGEVNVHIACNSTTQVLSEEELQELKDFNTILFDKVLRLEKSFLIVDNANKENSHIVVPVVNGKIDWSTVRTHKSIPKIEKPIDELHNGIQVNEVEYLHTIIAPWYRYMLPDQYYIVTKICNDKTPLSPFPTADYDSFKNYFIQKYQTQITSVNQPLVEVKAISSKMHCLRPRTTNPNQAQSKRKRQLINDDFEEHLVPELCTKFDFPAVLWLKATCLPSVLHRLVSLLLAEELRININRDLKIGVLTLPPGVTWDPLLVDANCDTKDECSESVLGIINDNLGNAQSRNGVQKRTSNPLSADEQEPVDIERCDLESVRVVEIRYYETFISQSLPSSPVKVLPKSIRSIPVKRIKLLDGTLEGLGPQQYEILQALTSATANDIINLERLETLGDSFLKYAISQYLYQQHNIDEGKLTTIKGKLLGNRNLLYSAQEKKLGEVMRIYDFDPCSDWVPPSMCVPRFLQEILSDKSLSLSPNILLKLNISAEERQAGVLDTATMSALIDEVCASPEETEFQTTMESFLNRISANDKTLADCVEALIGCYLKAFGIRGALLLLGWLQILPADKATPAYMFDLPPPSGLFVQSGDVNHHLRACSTIEERLGYKFRDRSFLLQALTHPSYMPNRITDNYQRLEFLGDALLDFLITCHIYESCGVLTPGQLTDLRSSLVNNITFASLVVRHGLHQFLLAQSPKLMDMIDRFVRLQEGHMHDVTETVLFLVNEDETETAEAVDVPKVLGDLFESLAGAIYLDSNMSLTAVWDVYYRLMHKEIDKFSKNVPKQAIRLLHEHLGQNKPFFHKTEVDEERGCIKVIVEIVTKGEKRQYEGFGDNKRLAKMAASKLAMRDLVKVQY